MVDYYSFRNDEIDIPYKLDRHEHKGNLVFTHDFTKGLPEEYNDCDLFYSEPSWLAGYNIFCERAGVLGTSYPRYIEELSKLTYGEIPIVLVIGKKALSKMNPDYSELKIKMNGYWETAYGWGIDLSIYTRIQHSNYYLISLLANRFNKVGDMSCGYGNTGRIFWNQGKNFIMSDISSKVVYYVANKLMGYENIS